MHRIGKASLVGVVALVVACGPTRRTEETGKCASGDTTACTCAGGAKGTAACLADESGFGACACGSEPACALNESKACGCEGGLTGTQACLPDRSGFGACACESVCAPSSVAGCTCANGLGGSKVCNAGGTGFGECVCDGPVNCLVSSLVASGEVRTSRGNVSYAGQAVTQAFTHRRGSGGGCLASGSIAITLGSGACRLDLSFGAMEGSFGGLLRASLATGGCPGFDVTDTFVTPPGYAAYWFTGTTSVTDGPAAGVCVAGARISFPSRPIVLRSASGAPLTLNLAGLTLDGQLASLGSADATCVDASECRGRWASDETLWCTEGCGAGRHDGGAGVCVAVGTCSDGFHDDGAGRCVLVGCASGFHDGGGGVCVAELACSPGYDFDVFSGDCVQAGATCGTDAPEARAGADWRTEPGVAVTLDGSLSPGLGPLQYEWTLVAPANAVGVQLGSARAATTTFSAGSLGVYTVRLRVKDSRGCSTTDDVIVRVGPGPVSLDLQVTWAEPTGDLDLHLVGPGGTFFDVYEVSYLQTHPDWGYENTTTGDGLHENDPQLVQDDLWGFGPERIALPEAFDATYRMGVAFYCDSGVFTGGGVGIGHATATATVRVNGAIVDTLTRVVTPTSFWEPFSITVSGDGSHAEVNRVDTATDAYASSACH